MLAMNGFAAVLASGGSRASILLAGIFLAGNAAICATSFWKGSRAFGKLEYACLVLLFFSLAGWLIFKAPIITLCISLFAHFIGALPTYKKIWNEPASESTAFWFFFFAASALSIFASPGGSIATVVFPVYMTFVEGSLFVLSLRGGQNAFILTKISGAFTLE